MTSCAADTSPEPFLNLDRLNEIWDGELEDAGRLTVGGSTAQQDNHISNLDRG